MLHITCYKDECETPNFVIPLPNTHTGIGYADNLELTKGAVPPAIVDTSEAAAGVTGGTTFAPVVTDTTRGREKAAMGLTAVQPWADTDYLVVYCDSGHKNYIPFNN